MNAITPSEDVDCVEKNLTSESLLKIEECLE